MKKAIITLLVSTAAFAQSTSAKDALDALRGLNSAIDAGINLRDYTKRLADAKIVVDRFAADQPKDPQRAALEEIMRVYVLVGKAFAARAGAYENTTPLGEAVVADSKLESCEGVAAVVKQSKSNAHDVGIRLIARPQPLLQCAAAKLAEIK